MMFGGDAVRRWETGPNAGRALEKAAALPPPNPPPAAECADAEFQSLEQHVGEPCFAVLSAQRANMKEYRDGCMTDRACVSFYGEPQTGSWDDALGLPCPDGFTLRHSRQYNAVDG